MRYDTRFGRVVGARPWSRQRAPVMERVPVTRARDDGTSPCRWSPGERRRVMIRGILAGKSLGYRGSSGGPPWTSNLGFRNSSSASGSISAGGSRTAILPDLRKTDRTAIFVPLCAAPALLPLTNRAPWRWPYGDSAASVKAQRAFTPGRASGRAGSASSTIGLPTSTASPWAREMATLMRLRLNRNSGPCGR